MKLVSIHLKSALIALAIFLPVTHANGMSYLPSWFSRTPKAAEEAVKKEVAKVVTEKVIEKTTPGQYAARGALAVAQVAGNAVVGTAEFALNHKQLSILTGAGIYMYLNRDKIKQKLEAYKPYLKVAGVSVAAAGALIAGKSLHDLWKSNPDVVKSLLGSASAAQELPKQELPNLEAIWQQVEQEQKKESIIAQAAAPIEDVDYEALWNESQQLNLQKEENDRQRQRQFVVQEAAWQEAEHARAEAAAQEVKKQEEAWQEIERERARIEGERKKEIAAQEAKNQEIIWQEIEHARVQAEELKKKEEAHRIAQQEAIKENIKPEAAPRKLAVHHIPGVEPRPALKPAAIQAGHDYGYEETPEQFARRFTHGHQEGNGPFIHHVYVPQPILVRDADTPLVEEFHEMEEADQAANPWAQEFKEQEDAQRALEELDAQHPAVVSDPATFGAAHDVHALRDLHDRYESRNEAYERGRQLRRGMGNAQNGRVRIIYQGTDGEMPRIQPSRITPADQQAPDYIPTPSRPMQKLPAPRL